MSGLPAYGNYSYDGICSLVPPNIIFLWSCPLRCPLFVVLVLIPLQLFYRGWRTREIPTVCDSPFPKGKIATYGPALSFPIFIATVLLSGRAPVEFLPSYVLPACFFLRRPRPPSLAIRTRHLSAPLFTPERPAVLFGSCKFNSPEDPTPLDVKRGTLLGPLFAVMLDSVSVLP